jgi:hypothetical protein
VAKFGRTRTMGLGGLALAILYPLALRPAHLKWGATDDEEPRELPGTTS